jgi:hypothetical protein
MQENLPPPPPAPVDQPVPNRWWLFGLAVLCLALLAGSVYFFYKPKASVLTSVSPTVDTPTVAPTTSSTTSMITSMITSTTTGTVTTNNVVAPSTAPNTQTSSNEEPFPELGLGRTMTLQVGHRYGATSEVCSVEVHSALTINVIQAGKVMFTLDGKSGSVGINENIHINATLDSLKVKSVANDSVVFTVTPIMIEC